MSATRGQNDRNRNQLRRRTSLRFNRQATRREVHDQIAYTIKELAEALGVGEGTIVGLRDRGELKGKLVGKQILFHRAEVDKFFGVRSS